MDMYSRDLRIDPDSITLRDVKQGKATFEEYMKNCYERNKDGQCWRESNSYPLCKDCPKAKKERSKK